MKSNSKYDISIIVCIYNSSWNKLLLTLDSILQTKNCLFEIVVTDDGSMDNNFSTLKEYFKKEGFDDYTLIEHNQNRGTVLNFLDGVHNSYGDWIKPISPGDCIYDENTLKSWLDYVIREECRWSFGDAQYYDVIVNKEYHTINQHDYPIDLAPYKKGKDKTCRWNYFVLNDYVNGANTLCMRSVLIEYLEVIKNRVIYAEDNIYRLMMFDNIVGKYYPKCTVRYEYGCGISTSKNKLWEKRIHNDLVETNKVITERDSFDQFQCKIFCNYSKWFNTKGMMKKIVYLFFNKGLKVFLMRKSSILMRILR